MIFSSLSKTMLSYCLKCRKNTKSKNQRVVRRESRYIYQNELNKSCFQHDIAYGHFKYLTRRSASDKILRHRGLALMVYKYLDKKSSCSGIKNENISHKKLAEELRRPIIRKFNKRKVFSSFIDNICGADLANMQLISKFNK